MKTMESSSWNKKWHLKEGNIVNDNKELSLNPTTKNNLNADLEFSESPTQENPQNLIRHRRSNGNNQPQNTFVPVDVPGDGSCLFWATALAYLIPVEDNSVVFAERFKRLFGAKESGNIRHIRELIRKYDPFSDNIRSDRTFNRLVTRVLRDRVVDYISLRENGYREFITGDFNQYLNNMRNRNTWGGEPEIVAMSNMLDASIAVDADGAVHSYGNYGYNIPPEIPIIRLYHVNAARSASQGNERNHYNFGLERNLHQHITNEVVPELVDHLFQIDENNNFKQRFQSFLDQIPRPSGVGAAPAKQGFYVNFFAGMFTTLKNTELFDRLGLAELHFKLCTISDADEVPFLKIVAITEEPTTKKLEEYVFVISEKRYSRQIMGAIFSRDDRRWLEESSFLFSEGDDSYHLRSRAHTRIGEIEFKSGAAIIISKRNNKDRVNVRAEQLTDQELPERMRVKFRRIEKHHKHKIGEYKSNLLEDLVKNLSSETVDDPRRDIDIVQAVQSNVKKLFEYIYDINRKYHTRLPNIQGALEAADHGFTAGALINFKYRYNLELYLELLLGIEGYIDIALLVRGSQRVKKAMPILMEIKTGQEQGGRTNPQRALREAESYTQGLQQNNRPFVTLADRVVRVGFNMDYANPIAMSVAELQPPAPIIRSIFKSVNSILRGQERRDDIKTSITNQLKKIYNLSPGVQGSNEPQYLSRLFIGHAILNSIENDETRIDKHVLTYRKLQQTTRGTRRSHDITTSVFIERTITGSNTGDSRVLVIHFHEGGRSNVDINDPTLRVPLNGIINQANCKEVIEVYVDARFGNDGSLKFLTEDNGVIIQDFTNSVNDYFQANVANHWEIHNMPDFHQADNLKRALDVTMSYQPKKGQDNKVDLGPYGDMFTNIGKNLFSIKSLITSEAYFAAVLSGLLNSYSDIEFDQGDFKINVRPEFQVGGGERIDLFINVMNKNPADSDVLIGLELKYGDGRTTVDSMDRALEKAEKVQLRRYGLSRNIRAITEGANFFVTLPVGFVSRAEASDSLVITRKQFVAYDIERSFLGQVHQLGRSVQRNEQTLESVTLQQNPDYRYWLSDQDIRRIAHLDNTYSNMFDVHAMNNNYDTSGRGLVVVTDRYQGVNTGELREQIRQFIDNVDNNRIMQQQGVPTRTFIVNQGGDHWTTLVISQQNGQYHGYYVDSLGSGIPDNIRQILIDYNINNNNLIDFQIRQQADGYNCGLWVLENARDINTMLQENKDVVWLRVQLAPERLSRNSEQYFINRRRAFSQRLHDNQPNGDGSQHGGGFQSCNKNQINEVIEQSKYLNTQEGLDFFEYQTGHGNYNYWLQQQDIADIARVLYNYGSDTANTLFEITGAPEHLANQLRQFQNRVYTQGETRPLTLIINLSNNHWVTLVVFHHNGQYHGYYVDSLYDSTKSVEEERHEMPDDIRQILENHNINHIIDFRIHQQDDGHNCGLWSLENANDINAVLHENILNNVPINDVEIRRRLENPRNEIHFENVRQNLVSRLREDDLRIDNLSELGYIEADQFLNTQFCLATLAVIGTSIINSKKTMPKRSINDCKVNSKVFLNYINDIENDSKRTQLIQSMSKFEIVGDSKYCSSINKLIYHQEITNYLNKTDKVINTEISAEDDELTALHLAAYYGDNNKIVLLIEQGVNVDVRSKNGWTPLHLASQYANREGADLLIENKADPHARSTHWWTPLHLAAQSGDIEVLKELVELFKVKKISISIKSREGWTPLHLAIQFGHQDTIYFLIKQGADVNAPAKGGWTPLHLASRYNNTEAVRLLLEKVNDVNSQVKRYNKWTALHFAAQLGNKEMIRLLVDHGAIRSIRDKDSMTARDIAQRYGTQEILDIVDDEAAARGMEILARNFKRVLEKIIVKDELRRKRMLEDSKHEIVSNRETNEVKQETLPVTELTNHHKHRHLRAINVADEYVASSSAITLSSPINSIVNWFKEAGIMLINVVKPINGWHSVENDNNNDNTEDKVKINGSASLVENKAVKDINANMPFWRTSNVSKVKEQIVTQHQQYGPTTLDIGDQLVNQTNKNGILQLLDLFIRKWTGQKLPRWRVDVSDSAVEVVVQAESIIDEFMQQIKESAMSCGIQPTVKKIINSCDLQVVKAKVQQKLNAGQIEDIPQILYDKIVQANIERIELHSTPKQSKKLSQDMLGKLSKIKQLLLNKEVELPITQKAIFGYCTRNRFNGYIGRKSHNNLLSAKLNKDQHVKQNNTVNINNNDQDSDDIISEIKNNDLKRLKAYLEAGKDANTFSRGGMTLLMRAVSNNCSTDLVKLLIEYGADVNREDKDGETAINIASYNGNLELIKVLISGGAIIKNKTAKNSPFNSVAESSMPQNIKNKIIKLLSNNLSNVDSSNNKLNKDNDVISNLVEQMSAMNSINGNVGFSTAESTNIVPPYLGQNPNCYNEVKVFA